MKEFFGSGPEILKAIIETLILPFISFTFSLFKHTHIYKHFLENKIKKIDENIDETIEILYTQLFKEVFSGALKSLLIREQITLIKEIIEKINKLKKSVHSTNKTTASPSIVGLFAIKRSRNNLLASGILFATLIVHQLFTYYNNYPLINSFFVLSIVLMILITIDEYILSYRVKKGYFGTNKEEAKEIINFILNNAKDSDNFNGPDGKLRVFDEILEGRVETESRFNTGLNPSLP